MYAESIKQQADDKWSDVEQLDDLKWDLGAITNRREAIDFLLKFENRFCVYSPYVEKLYTTYEFVVPEEEGYGHVTVLPDPTAYHDTFHHISARAVEETGIHVFPGEAIGKEGLYIKIPSSGFGRSRELPFHEGVKLLTQRYHQRGDFFLPVLQNGDLREYENQMPSLHLHRICADVLVDQLSELAVNQLRNTVADHLIELFIHFQRKARA